MADERPGKWRERAEELRTLADLSRNAESHKILVDMAEQWERMADLLERTEAQQPREESD